MRTIGKFEQGTPEWFRARRGMLTASEFGKIIHAREFTLNKLRAEKLEELRGAIPRSFTSKATEWGKIHEAQARSYTELTLLENGIIDVGQEIEVPGLVISDEHLWLGFSADGLIIPLKIGVELKCPFNQDVHIGHFAKRYDGHPDWRQNIPKQYYPQVQGGMMVTGWKKWIYASFDPRLLEEDPDRALYIVVVERDDVFIARMFSTLQRFWRSLGIKKAELERIQAEASA